MADHAPTWLSVEAAAERLGVTVRSAYRMIDHDGLVAYRIGRSVKLKEADVDAFIEAQRIQPGTITYLAMSEDRHYRERHKPRGEA